MDLENTTGRLRRRENGVEMASYFHIWMSPGHFHVVLDVASCYLNLSNNKMIFLNYACMFSPGTPASYQMLTIAPRLLYCGCSCSVWVSQHLSFAAFVIQLSKRMFLSNVQTFK